MWIITLKNKLYFDDLTLNKIGCLPMILDSTCDIGKFLVSLSSQRKLERKGYETGVYVDF